MKNTCPFLPGMGAFFALAAVLSICAETLPITEFTPGGGNALAKGWVWHGWSGYEPKPQATCTNGVLAVSGSQGAYGWGILSAPRLPCRAGDVVRVHFRAKGKGRVRNGLQYYTKGGGYNQGAKSNFGALSDTWRDFAFVYTVADGTAGKTALMDVSFGGDKGGVCHLAAVRAEIERRVFDDYEDAAVKRAGDPVLVDGFVAPGLLEKTRLGVYRASRPLALPFPGAFTTPADGDNPFFETGARLYALDVNAALVFTFGETNAAAHVLLAVDRPAENGDLLVSATERGGNKPFLVARVPQAALPASFAVAVSRRGEFRFTATSLADSSTVVAKGECAFFKDRAAPFAASLMLLPRGGEASATLDERFAGRASTDVKLPPVPLRLERAVSFDPAAAGWPLVFHDEFDGAAIDETKWFAPSWGRDWRKNASAFVTNGVLHIVTDWDAKHEKLQTASLWSQQKWTYGYFEARLKFTKNNGWWAAFWLYGDSNCNPFVDGWEIDVFEDYYTRDSNPAAPRKGILDHNLHVNTGSLLKSWNYNSALPPGTLDDFHVIGCKWTPFEVTYYLDGKRIAAKAVHSPHDSVTFDPDCHAAGLAPLHAIVSGQIMDDTWSQHDKTGVVFPEHYLVDWVRVYALPPSYAANAPRVALVDADAAATFVQPGATVPIRATVTPPADGARVTGVYLFDSGYLVDYKTEPPFDFAVPLTEAHYRNTRYMRPGRQGKTPTLGNGYPHVFAVFAQDDRGRVGRSETTWRIAADLAQSTPYEGIAQKIPGDVQIGRYDAGGNGTAYCDTTKGNGHSAGNTWRQDEDVDAGPESVGSVATGEWLTYSVDVARTGRYTAAFRYGTPDKGTSKAFLLVDGKCVGAFTCREHAAPHWGADTTAEIRHLALAAGRHKITLVCAGRYNFNRLRFTEE